jgi:hypothetical protein
MKNETKKCGRFALIITTANGGSASPFFIYFGFKELEKKERDAKKSRPDIGRLAVCCDGMREGRRLLHAAQL